MRYSNAVLGITVQMLFQFISYFGSFNLSRGKNPTRRFLTFCPERSTKTKLFGPKAKAPNCKQPAGWRGTSSAPRPWGRRARTLLQDVPVPKSHYPAEHSGLGPRHLLSRCLQGLFLLEEDLETLLLPTHGVLSTALAALWTHGAVGAHSGAALRGLPQHGRYPGGHDTACSPFPH